jgi:hypothetical protein
MLGFLHERHNRKVQYADLGRISRRATFRLWQKFDGPGFLAGNRGRVADSL